MRKTFLREMRRSLLLYYRNWVKHPLSQQGKYCSYSKPEKVKDGDRVGVDEILS